MDRSKKGELTKLRGAMVHSRLAAVAAREALIEALGDFMCGNGLAPPASQEIEALARLERAQEEAEAAYASCVASQAAAPPAMQRRSVG